MNIQGAIAFTFTERTPERVVAQMSITAGIKNPFGVAHAGAILWFADVAASVLLMGPGKATEGMSGFPLAISLNANLLGNQNEGTFKAVSSFVKRGRTVSVVHAVITGVMFSTQGLLTASHRQRRFTRHRCNSGSTRRAGRGLVWVAYSAPSVPQEHRLGA